MCVLSRGHLDVFQIKDFGGFCQPLSLSIMRLWKSAWGDRVWWAWEDSRRVITFSYKILWKVVEIFIDFKKTLNIFKDFERLFETVKQFLYSSVKNSRDFVKFRRNSRGACANFKVCRDFGGYAGDHPTPPSIYIHSHTFLGGFGCQPVSPTGL